MKTLYSLAFCLLWGLSAQLVAGSNVELQGDLLPGAMIIGQAPANSRISLNDTMLKQTADGYFVFGFGRDAVSGDVLKVVQPGGEVWQQTLSLEPRQYDIQSVTGIDKKIQSSQKSEATWKRIADESKAVSAARADHVERRDFLQSFIWPLNGPITGVYGSQRVYNGEPGRPHYGLDIAAPTGTLVYAPADAIVTLAHPDMYYSGGTLIMDHGYGISSTFIHLSEVLVKVGDEVKQGQAVAKVGAGGRASGPHLDWRMNWYQRRLDPQLLLPEQTKQESNND